MATAHNRANKGEIAKIVLMCGDPLRAKYISENFLNDSKLVSDVRNVYCYTGTYKGKEISIMGSGMGVASMGIYSYELYEHYDVETIIRVGTCGAYNEKVKIGDIVVGVGVSSDSNYAAQFYLNGTFAPLADFNLLKVCDKVCNEHNVNAHFGNIYCTDVFYDVDKDQWKKWANLGCLAVEMESYGLYVNAARCKKRALTIMSVSDSFITKESVSVKKRQDGFKAMMEVALDTALGA